MFINLHCHTKFSWDCFSDIDKLTKFVASQGQTALAITDHGSVSGAIKFHESCKKNKIKPIIGCELYLCTNQQSSLDKHKDNRRLNHLVVLAKNETGYKNLLKLVSMSNYAERFYYDCRIDEQLLFENSEGLIAINGHFDTSIFDCLFFNLEAIANSETMEEAMQYVSPSYEEDVLEVVNRYKNVFGDDFYIECQLFDPNDKIQQLAGKLLFELAQKHGIKAVGTGDCHYIEPKDCPAHRTFVAIKLNKTVKSLANIGYFYSGKYGIITNDEAEKNYPPELIAATNEIADKIEMYAVTAPQAIPKIFENKDEAFNEVSKIVNEKANQLNLTSEEYLDRIKYELEMTYKGELQDYFLIVRDYLNWARSQGILTGCGRGSVGGALIAYLLGITSIDSVKYGLMWDRFMGPDRIENKVLPDIDSDFQGTRRDEVVSYIKQKYGEDKVCGVVTFGMLHGKSAVRDVLKAWGLFDPKQLKLICDKIPQKDKISDKLADFKDEYGSDSIILYTLIKEPENLAEYVKYEDGKIVGDLATFFEIAIELEGAIRNESRHASAIIISNRPIYEIAPLVKDSEGNLICAFDMYSFELAGLVKFDILGLKSLDGLAEVNNLLKDVDIGTIFKDQEIIIF